MTVNQFEFQRVVVSDVKINYKTKSTIKDPIDAANATAAIAKKVIGKKYKEYGLVFYLSNYNDIIGYSINGIGTSQRCMLDFPDIFRGALLSGAQAIILAHNHPSGYNDPSNEDLQLFRKLKEIGELIGITVLDSIIVSTAKKYVSLSEL